MASDLPVLSSSNGRLTFFLEDSGMPSQDRSRFVANHVIKTNLDQIFSDKEIFWNFHFSSGVHTSETKGLTSDLTSSPGAFFCPFTNWPCL